MEKENSTEEEPVGFPAPNNVNETDQNIKAPTNNHLSVDETAGPSIDTSEQHLKKIPYFHENDVKPSTTTENHVVDNELHEDTSNDIEIRSQEYDNLSGNTTSSSSSAVDPAIQKEDLEKDNSVIDITLKSTATGTEITGPEDGNSTDNSLSSTVRLSDFENSTNVINGEPDIQKEDHEKGNIVNDRTPVSCTETRVQEGDNFGASSSSLSPAQLSSSQNSINALASQPDIQKENHEKCKLVNDTILDCNAAETNMVNHQCDENMEMISKDVIHATFSRKDGESPSVEETVDTESDHTDNTSDKEEESLLLYESQVSKPEAKTAASTGKTSVLTKFVKLCATSNVFRHLSKKTDEQNDSNEKDNNASSKGDSQQQEASQEVTHKAPERSRWSLASLSLIRISNDKDQVNKAAPKEVFFESPELKTIKGRIVLYTKLWCQNCKEARVILRKRKLRYFEINIDVFPSRKAELEKITGSSYVPKVFFNQVLIGGLKELKGLDESGQLEEKIEYVAREGPSPKAPLPPFSGEDDVSSRGGVDELAVIVRKMKDSIVVKDRFYKFRRVTNCFLGSEAVDFLSEDQLLEREGAIEFARKLVKELFFRHVLEENTFEDGNHLYRFLDQDPVISQCQNIPRGIIQLKRQTLVELSHRLRFLLYAILDAYTSEDGRHIAYRTIHGSEEFARYLRIAEELQRVDLNKTAKEERLAFFINLYNLMAIHAILVWGRPEGALERRKMYNDFKYVIGGCAYSLSDIQNGILRSNQRPPYTLIKPFGITDKRFKVSLPYPEPLIHFALVSGNRSAPALRCFSPKNVDRELMEAARGFLRSGAFVFDSETMTISVTRILNWYSVDFGKNEVEVLKHAANYLEIEKTQTLLELLDSTQLKVVYQPYDWRLNS